MNDSTTQALALADIGIRVFPCRPLDKRPSISAWPTEATIEGADIVMKFNGDSNLAIRCGHTEADIAIFVVDIDIKDGQPGAESWAQFCDEHPEVRDQAQLTASVSTPSGGWHFYFAVPEGFECPRNGKPFPGVDIRGEGGYVLAPPSKLPNGEYAWVRTIEDDGIMYAPAALMEAVLTPRSEAPEVPRSVPPVSTPTPARLAVGDDEGPLEWANRNLDSQGLLSEAGWQYSHQKGADAFWARPGKNLRDGHSAVVHEDGVTVIWTTDLPPGWDRLGKQGRDGSVVMTPFDVFCATKHGCDVRAAMSAIRKELMPKVAQGVDIASLIAREAGVPVSAGAETPASTVRVEASFTSSGLNLPSEFWESREWLGHIRQAAHSRMASADAILGAILARYSATIPVSFRIPPIVMTASTFDHMSVLVSESSGGKSGAAGIARELMPPVHEKVIRWDQPVGSGEGLVELFYDWVMEEDDKGKQREVHKKVFNAVHFTADEGMALVQTSRRDSTTIGSVLCSAWSGTQLGQANASRDRKRIVEAGTGRVTGVCGIQLSLGHHFLADEWVRQGLSGRLVFFAAEDPTIPHPDDVPAWPGPLQVAYHPITPTMIAYDDAIAAEIRNDHWTRTTGQRHEAPIDGHTRLAKLKISGIIALIEGRQDVTLSDWELATQILNSSTRIRNVMLTIKQQFDREAIETRAIATAQSEITKEDFKERKAVARLSDAIIARVAEEGPLATGKLRKATTSSGTRHRFEAALALAVQRGAVAVDNEVVSAA